MSTVEWLILGGISVAVACLFYVLVVITTPTSMSKDEE
jgi:hypothetical protein